MRRILTAAAMSVLAMTYFVAPDAVTAAVNGTTSLFLTIGRAGLSVLTLGTGGAPAPAPGAPAQGGGSVVELEDGTKVWVPAGAQLTPTEGEQP